MDQSEGADHLDQLCSLPYEVLVQILSFLQLKDAVRTSNLSKRNIGPHCISGDTTLLVHAKLLVQLHGKGVVRDRGYSLLLAVSNMREFTLSNQLLMRNMVKLRFGGISYLTVQGLGMILERSPRLQSLYLAPTNQFKPS
ncbi:hypothetical protein CDL15_Pgr005877 [Punica granatum]|uniref:F-box domain-containing protein n=1 Tax=Punica granatum TaxID=22663 RepID=A0A218WGT5_PUNGR|nr:hypothetical protein CDL15_Pgr005877 [Punica granatum]PKI59673.1 hypothetical protein CRG98_019935 [Punica granatum]